MNHQRRKLNFSDSCYHFVNFDHGYLTTLSLTDQQKMPFFVLRGRRPEPFAISITSWNFLTAWVKATEKLVLIKGYSITNPRQTV